MKLLALLVVGACLSQATNTDEECSYICCDFACTIECRLCIEVCCMSICGVPIFCVLCRLLMVLHFHPEPPNQFQPNLVQSSLGYISEFIDFSRTTGSTDFNQSGTNHPWIDPRPSAIREKATWAFGSVELTVSYVDIIWQYREIGLKCVKATWPICSGPRCLYTGCLFLGTTAFSNDLNNSSISR